MENEHYLQLPGKWGQNYRITQANQVMVVRNSGKYTQILALIPVEDLLMVAHVIEDPDKNAEHWAEEYLRHAY